MEEYNMLRRIRAGDTSALEWTIQKYSSYVFSIIRNRGQGHIGQQDAEELSADVFAALWRGSLNIKSGALRPWLGTVARNKAMDFLRKRKIELQIEDEAFISIPDEMWLELEEKQRRDLVRKALQELDPMDREIFFRTYNLCESSTQIAGALKMSPSTVRSRLSRGKQKLKTILMQGGYFDEADL